MQHQTSDLPIRIKNGYLAKKTSIEVSHSKIALAILELLKKEGYVGEYEQRVEGSKSAVEVTLLYKDRIPAMNGVKIISKPGRRIYSSVTKIKPVLGGMGIALISTPAGIMTDKMAREQKIGGEVLFYIW